MVAGVFIKILFCNTHLKFVGVILRIYVLAKLVCESPTYKFPLLSNDINFKTKNLAVAARPSTYPPLAPAEVGPT